MHPAALLILLLSIPVDHPLAQPLPDSAKQPVRVHVTGDEQLNQQIHQEMALNLIAAEARIDPESAVWLLDVRIARPQARRVLCVRMTNNQ